MQSEATLNINESEEHSTASPRLIGKGLLLPFILITTCFALWGAANNLTDLLVPAFKKY